VVVVFQNKTPSESRRRRVLLSANVVDVVLGWSGSRPRSLRRSEQQQRDERGKVEKEKIGGGGGTATAARRNRRRRRCLRPSPSDAAEDVVAVGATDLAAAVVAATTGEMTPTPPPPPSSPSQRTTAGYYYHLPAIDRSIDLAPQSVARCCRSVRARTRAVRSPQLQSTRKDRRQCNKRITVQYTKK